MPDEAFMKKLEKERGKGRDEYPVRAMWNALGESYRLREKRIQQEKQKDQ